MRSFLLFLSFSLISCSTPPIRGQRGATEVWNEVCAIGKENQEVTGSLWVSFERNDASAQFPALVRAHEKNGFIIEIVDLLGSPQARITYENETFRVDDFTKKITQLQIKDWVKRIRSRDLQELLLGRFPCESLREPEWISDHEIRFHNGSTASLGLWSRKPWLESGEFLKNEMDVKWKFLKADDSGNPTQWEATWESPKEKGSLRTRFRDRKVLRKN